MLSISPIARADYYLDLAREDYYLAGGEPPGIWQGTGAQTLGLVGAVTRDALERLLAGTSLKGRPLVQNAGRPDRQAGWDLTFSAPKSVSTAWAMADAATQQAIQEAQAAGVRAALDYLERHATLSRRGKGGTSAEPAQLVIATFEHGTSRAQDPQLHTHCLVTNVACRADGTTGTLVSHPFYLQKLTAGAVYRHELARQLNLLGFGIVAQNGLFEIQGVSAELIQEFSKRRLAIQEELFAHGVQSAAAAEAATLATRTVKEAVPRSVLHKEWQQLGAGHGFTAARVAAIQDHHQTAELSDSALQEALRRALDTIAARQSYFARHELLRLVIHDTMTAGVTLERAEAVIDAALGDRQQVIAVGQEDLLPQFTTRALWDQETRLLEQVSVLATTRQPAVATGSVERLLSRRAELSAEQRVAVAQLTTSPAAIQLVNGLPGTGKTTLLDVCREAWEGEGLRVLGCALAAKAAQELSQGAGITSYTVAKLLHVWEQSAADTLQHHVQQLTRAARGQQTWELERIPLDARTVLVVDEAGMVDTPQLARLVEQVVESGARLVLVGDTRQLPAIGPGGGFAACLERVGGVELQEMRRQRHGEDLEALKHLASGNAQAALENFALRDLVTVCDTKQEAMERLVADWSRIGLLAPQQTSIITTTNREARAVNALCQAARLKAAGGTAWLAVQVGEEWVTTGDRVLFLENHRGLGVLNGDLGTVVKVNPLSRTLQVFLDLHAAEGGRLVTIPLADYSRLSLGYARTTHKEQGATVEQAFVLLGGSLQDRELSFVQASRHRERVQFYVDRLEAGEDWERLAVQMNRTSSKQLAHALTQSQDLPHEERAGAGALKPPSPVSAENELRSMPASEPAAAPAVVNRVALTARRVQHP